MKIELATAGAVAYLAYQASALPAAEECFVAKANMHSRDISQREISSAAALSMKNAGFDLNVTLASASVRPRSNTTQCVLTRNCIAYAARNIGADYVESIVALRNAWTSSNRTNLHDDAAAVPNAYLAATGPLRVYQSQPTSLPTGAEQKPPPFPIASPHPGPAASHDKREVAPRTEDPGYETYGCIYYNSKDNDWVCRNATFAFLMLDHMSSVDYDQKNGISVWDVSNPTNPEERYGTYSHCVSTTAGCNDAQANFYSGFVNPTTEPHVVSGFKEGHSSTGV